MAKNNTKKNKYNTSQLLNFAQDSYFERTSRPIYALIFLLPFIVFYEFGTLLINTDVLNQSQIRVVAFCCLQNFLEHLGFTTKVAWATPAFTVVIILIALQLSSRKKWYFIPADIVPMTLECSLLAVPLIVLSLFLNSSTPQHENVSQFHNDIISIQTNSVTVCSAVTDSNPPDAAQNCPEETKSKRKSVIASLVTSIGAGIYEELLFRLILICLLMIFFQNLLQLGQKKSIILSIIISATLFSAHHHIVFLNGQFSQASPFRWPEFAFRTIAGIYFAILFALRGFGITAGTHAFYDVIAVFINVLFFAS